MLLLPRLRLLAGLLPLLVLLPAEGAFAHAQLLSTAPRDNAIVQTAPEVIALNFNEPVTPLAVRLIGPDGNGLDLTGQAQGGATTEIMMPAEMAAGTHVLSWRVVSADGHPIAGSLLFSLGRMSGGAVDTASDGAVSAALWGAKALLFVAMFAGIGGAAFGALAPPPPAARRMAFGLTILGLVIAPVTLGLQGLDALGLSLLSFFDAGAWGAGLSTSYGATAIAATVAFAWATGALKMPPGKIPAWLGVAAAALAALSLALSGHASAAAPQWLTRPAVFLHIASVLFWAGALLPLSMLLRDASEEANRALASFSKGIPFAVAPLVLSGLILAVVQLGAPGPQWATAYGFILAGKLVLLFLLFGLAIWNRHWLTRPVLAGNAPAHQRLRRSIGWEMVLIVIILALVAGWRFTPPPRALADVPLAAEPITEHLIDGDTMAMVTISPGSAGPVGIEIMVSDIEHIPKEVLGVTFIMSSPEIGIEPIQRVATETGGIWRVDDLTIPVAGTWQLETEIRVSRFELARPRGAVSIP
ncbi:MAG TPA: copper resistance protein CopC [Devosia sp.]|nr:copper resistance protein CopC [Devosia sp.]